MDATIKPISEPQMELRRTFTGINHHSNIFCKVTACPSWENIKQGSKSENTNPFKSFLPLAGKMLTYLEAMRNPKKHMVKTLAMGRTAILMVPKRVCPPPTWFAPMVSTANKNLSMVFSVIPWPIATLIHQVCSAQTIIYQLKKMTREKKRDGVSPSSVQVLFPWVGRRGQRRTINWKKKMRDRVIWMFL